MSEHLRIFQTTVDDVRNIAVIQFEEELERARAGEEPDPSTCYEDRLALLSGGITDLISTTSHSIGHRHLLTARLDQRVVGFCDLSKGGNGKNVTTRINQLSILPRFRREGNGTVMLEFIKYLAGPASVLRTTIHPDDVARLGFYKHHDFDIISGSRGRRRTALELKDIKWPPNITREAASRYWLSDPRISEQDRFSLSQQVNSRKPIVRSTHPQLFELQTLDLP